MNKKVELIPKSLPYNFIPFPNDGKWHYAYNDSDLPKHNVMQGCNGYIDYEIKPCSKIAIDFRVLEEGKKYFVSGSAMKGLVRSNLEILSGSYPTFVDWVSMSYRDIAGDEKKIYREDLFGKGFVDIEKKIQVGYLKKEGDQYYISPAKTIGKDKFFRTVEEYRLKKDSIVINPKNLMYQWDEKILKEFKEIKNQIDGLTTKIEQFKKDIIDKKITHDMDKYFKRECNFNILLRNNKYLTPEELERMVINDLGIKLDNQHVSLVESYARRLSLKLKIHLKFMEEPKIKLQIKRLKESIQSFEGRNDIEVKVKELLKSFCEENGSLSKILKDNGIELEKLNNELTGKEQKKYHPLIEKVTKILKLEDHLQNRVLRRNPEFIPYQKPIFFTKDLSQISLSAKTEDGMMKGFLYCSTNASSKRRHYIINGEKDKANKIKISQKLINTYNYNMKSFRPPLDKSQSIDKERDENPNKAIKEKKDKIINFYDIFKEDADIGSAPKEGEIIFYTLEKGEVKSIGRTPYMKVLYKNQIEDIIKNEKTQNENQSDKNNKNIDYARAMFGYSQSDFKYEDQEAIKELTNKNYKSRLRFNPLIFEVNENQKPKEEKHFTLLDPKPSAFGMYLKQDSTDKVKTYNDDNLELNGYKYYKILEKEVLPVQDQKDGNYQSSKMVLRQDQIKEKDGITGRIYFSNLTKAELGLLIMSLDANEIVKIEELKDQDKKKTPIYETIGGAKPYGYGKVQIKIKELRVNEVTSKEMGLDDWLEYKEENNISHYTEATLKELLKSHFENINLDKYIRSKQEDEVELNWANMEKAGYEKEWILNKGDDHQRHPKSPNKTNGSKHRESKNSIGNKADFNTHSEHKGNNNNRNQRNHRNQSCLSKGDQSKLEEMKKRIREENK